MGVQASKVEEQKEADEEADPAESWSPDMKAAQSLVQELINVWGPPIQTLSRAGRAFGGLEALLGGGRAGTFDLQVSVLTAMLYIASQILSVWCSNLAPCKGMCLCLWHAL